jgi:hypothetical protein
MSYYIDGCVQELHCDSFHGPFAFVLSLTNWQARAFTGARAAAADAAARAEACVRLLGARRRQRELEGRPGRPMPAAQGANPSPGSRDQPSQPCRERAPPPPTDAPLARAGGETVILQPSTLDFWRGFVPGKGLELNDLVTLVPPRFNQLTVRRRRAQAPVQRYRFWAAARAECGVA